MKEYKTVRVSPNEEASAINVLGRFGWILEESREVYNESKEIVGVKESSKATVYGDGFFGGFMRGFTGNDGKIDKQVTYETQTNVTHFLSMRFSRDKSMKNYDRLVQLENEFNNTSLNYKPYVKVSKMPIAQTFAILILAVILMVSFINAHLIIGIVIDCLIAIALLVLIWVIYPKKHKKQIAQNNEIEKQNTEMKEAYNIRMKEVISEVDKILEENGITK